MADRRGRCARLLADAPQRVRLLWSWLSGPLDPLPRIRTELRVARAAVVLALALLGLASRPAVNAPAPDCRDPVEREAREGLTVAAVCDGIGRPVRGPARLLFGHRLDLNRASGAALEALPGIGPSRAAAIVAARGERPFRSVADLTRVSGIGPRTVEGLAGWVVVELDTRPRAVSQPAR